MNEIIYVKTNREQVDKEHIKLIVDTAAQLSLIKENQIVDKQNITQEEQTNIVGVANVQIKTLGSYCLTPKIDSTNFSFKFQVVPDEINIPFDGIIGRDIISQYNGVISYQDQTFKLNDYIFKLHTVDASNLICVPPRCEIITKIKCISQDQTIYCPKFRFNEEVITSECLTNIKNNEFKIAIINLSEKEYMIENPSIEFEPVNIDETETNLNIFNYSEVNVLQRVEQIKNSIDVSKLNSEEIESIYKSIIEYEDIVHLPGDKLSHTDATNHRITTSDNAPIFVKPYRLPHTQKQIINNKITEMLNDDIIEHSQSPYNAPLLLIPKKSNKTGEIQYRVVIDFRKLNDKTTTDVYPLPNITDILDQLGRSKYFTTLDLPSGYHQVPLHVDDREKTAFSTDSGHFQYKRMPQGLKNSSATFQRLMNSILSGLIGIKCFVYVDDIVVYANTLVDHEKKIIEVLQRFRESKLKINIEKCKFLQKECVFLGHVITENGIKPDPNKIKAVINFKTPQTPKDVKSFLGLVGYYRKFINNFSKIAYPLNSLLKKNVKFVWTPECEIGFNELKQAVTTEPILIYPQFDKPFIITCDASKKGLGVILSQGEIGSDKPIAFASRSLNTAEINYSTTEREMKAILFGINHFRPYIYGTKFTIVTDHKPLSQVFRVKDPGARLLKYRLRLAEYDCTIVYKEGKANTNADALSRIYATQTREIDGYLEFENYTKYKIITNPNIIEQALITENELDRNANVIFIPRKPNINSNELQILDRKFNLFFEIEQKNPSLNDILVLNNISSKYKNKLICLIYKEYEVDTDDYEELWIVLNKLVNVLQEMNLKEINLMTIKNNRNFKWEKIRPVLRYLIKNVKVVNYDTIIEESDSITEEQKLELIHEYHDSPTGGHQGASRTYKRMKQKYSWKNMKEDIQKYIKKCDSCQRNKITTKPIKMPLVITSTSSQPFEKIYLDIVGPLTCSQSGNKYILTAQDDLTKYSIAMTIPDQEAKTIAKQLVNNIICKYGIPDFVLTDQGTNFLSKLFKELCKLLNIHKLQTTAYHPQTNGALERSHRTLAEYLRHFCTKNQTDWDEFVQTAMFTYNTTPHTATGHTPFNLLFGYEAKLPSAITRKPQPLYNYDDYVLNLRSKMQEIREFAKSNIGKSKIKAKQNYDRHSNVKVFCVGDQVLMKTEAIKQGLCRKLHPLWNGPYTIVTKHSDVNYTIRVGKRTQKVHANRLKMYRI